MAKYMKRPETVEAVQWFKFGDAEDVDAYLVGVHSRCCFCNTCRRLMQNHGEMVDPIGLGIAVCPGDWIVTRADGRRFTCKPDIFEATYMPIDVDEDCEELKPPTATDTTIVLDRNPDGIEQAPDQEEDHYVK